MSTNLETNAAAVLRLSRFTSCCDGTEIVFVGLVPLTNGQQYQYIGATPYVGFGGELIPNQCYTFNNDLTVEIVNYPTVPTFSEWSAVEGCSDNKCPTCNPSQFCDCPENFVYNEVTQLCERTLDTVAEYSGTLLHIVAGNKSEFYCDSGIRLYPDITSLTWPILGDGLSNALYTLNENNGVGAAVIPTNNVINEAFGGNAPGCLISDGDGGRLNKAGIWATGFPNNQELSFEYCIEVEGLEDVEYVIGIAGDNYVKLYVDGLLAVDLNSPSNSVTTPFRHWHAFPLSLTPGSHTIKVSGLNFGSLAAFAAEIYEIDLPTFQANLLYPAIGAGNCGSTEAQLEPFIIFSTRDYIGQSIPNPNDPGVWSCPGGETVDYCNGVPICKITESIELACDCYLLIPCDGTAPFYSINSTYEEYLNTFVEVTGPDYTGCVYVSQTETEFCNEAGEDTIPTGVACDCDLRCWWVQNTNGFLYVDNDNVLQEVSSIDASPYTRVCSKTPPIAINNSIDFLITEVGDCDDDGCPDLCYKLTNCETDEVIHSNSEVLFQYTFSENNVVEILNQEGCWKVTIQTCNCIRITIDGTTIEALATGTFNGQSVFTFEYNSTVYYIWFNSGWFISEEIGGFIGTIASTESADDCPIFGSFDDPVTPDPSGWRSVPAGTVITTELCPEQCDCPIDVTVVSFYAECKDCIIDSYYRLKSCTNTDVIYTGLNLEAYIGQIIKTDCGCYEVELIDFVPTNPQIIQLVSIFDECIDCTREYYMLEDCNDDQNIIYTYTDLSIWLDKVVKLKGCTECWIVKEVVDPGLIYQSAGEVTLIQGYDDCIECEELIARCSTVFNTTIEEGQYQYIDVNGITQDIRVDSGEESEKYCVLKWFENSNPEGVYKYYGDCQVFEHDETPLPNECNCIDVTITPVGGIATTYSAVHTGEFYNSDKVYNLIVDSVPYFIWSGGLGGEWNLTDIIGSQTPGGEIGQIKSGIVECPVAPSGSWSPGLMPSGTVVQELFTQEGECAPINVKKGICPPPIFPNKRIVTPGYNTPICTPEKYDMITCNFADVMYKLVLEKRYGITNCCPEDDNKWIIKKELIDLQALKDPDYNCSECSCNCTTTNTCSTCKSGN